ncbi:hypothetical protein MRB53_022295 [Persea americana]|uniref:Uncharacterized protein n=1 Tax=Persea americana TaxID=3435 RepID=A0ACC2L6I1_PERAE|nr:hypothetical protein MRB53_022295 [Persea americana]
MNVGEGEKQMRLNQWEKHYSYDKGLSNEQAREVAERLGIKNPFGVGTCLEQEKVSIGMTAEQMKDFITTNARLGFCWQFITLAGFHADALVINTFATDFARRGVLAYVERIQREEWNNGVDTLAHQKWSGANYYDRVLRTVQGVTEEQFRETWTSPGAMAVNQGTMVVVAKARM